jgi:hypothetical protein
LKTRPRFHSVKCHLQKLTGGNNKLIWAEFSAPSQLTASVGSKNVITYGTSGERESYPEGT